MSQPLDAQFAATAGRVEPAALREACLKMGIPQSPQDMMMSPPWSDTDQQILEHYVAARVREEVASRLAHLRAYYRPEVPELSFKTKFICVVAGGALLWVALRSPAVIGSAANAAKEYYGARRAG